MDTFNQIIPKTIVLTVILVVFAIFYLDIDIEKNTPVKKNVWNQSFERLREIWSYDIADNIDFINAKCPELKVDINTNKNYFLCNPEYLKCFLDHSPISFKIDDKMISVKGSVTKIIIVDKPLNLNMISGVHTYINLNHQDQVKKVVLENICHETYIPFKGKKSYFIDKFQVRNLSVNRWIKQKKNTESKLINEAKLLSHPSTNLTFDEKKRFCEDHGKALLVQSFWEQATFFPDYANNKLFKHPYPWTKKHQLYDKEDIEANEDQVKENLCSKIHSLECTKKNIPYIHMSDDSISWSGVKEVLGGYAEVFSNKNVLVSNSQISFDDKLNKLGVYKNLKDYKQPTAFRCMREL